MYLGGKVLGFLGKLKGNLRIVLSFPFFLFLILSTDIPIHKARTKGPNFWLLILILVNWTFYYFLLFSFSVIEYCRFIVGNLEKIEKIFSLIVCKDC